MARRRAGREASKIADDLSKSIFLACLTISALAVIVFAQPDGWGGYLWRLLGSAAGSIGFALTFEFITARILASRDQREPWEFEALPDLSVELPADLMRQTPSITKRKDLPKPGEDFSDVQTHEEVRTALRQLSTAWLRHEAAQSPAKRRTRGSLLAQEQLNHTVGTIAQIAGQIAQHPAVAEKEEVRIPFLELIADAEESLRRFEIDCDDLMSREVLANIRALAKQIEGFGPRPDATDDESTRSQPGE